VTGLTSEEIFAVVVVVVVSIALAAVGLALLRRLRMRRDQLRGELSGRPEAMSDRAFNRIAMARRELNVLAGQGSEVPRARELIGEAQAAFDTRQFDRAYSLAQSAHETLVAARQRSSGPLPSAPSPAVGPEPTEAPPVGGTAAAPAPAAPPKIPPHRAEAQFQLRLLSEEIARVEAGGTTGGRAASSSRLRDDAQRSFDRGDYAEAFRLALKGRREAGASVEALAPPPAGVAPPAGPTGPAGARPTDPAQTAAAIAASDRCPSCGHPTRSDDAFCRGCGAPRTPAVCGSCGAARLPSDTFCGRCGASFA